MAIIVIAASIFATALYTKPRTFIDKGDSYYSTNESTTTVQDEYLPLWVLKKPEKRADRKIETENAEIISQSIRAGHYEFVTSANQATAVKINTIYFPGWQAKVDGKKIPINYENQFGLITFNLPEGEHKVIINYARSPIHFASEIISALAILTTAVYFLIVWRKRNS